MFHLPFRTPILTILAFMTLSTLFSQAWKSFNILSGNPNATGNEIRFLNGTTGCLGSTIATTNGIPAGNNNLPYGAAFDPTEGKLYYAKAGTTAGTTVFNVYNNTGAVATNTNLATISGGEFFRMGVGQDGNVYGTITALVIQLSASAPRIDIMTVKLTRYNPTTNTFTVLGNIQCPAAYASTMPAPYNDGNYWSASDATTTPFYAAQLGSATYGDLVVAPDNTMYMSIGKKLIRIPNYTSITGTALIPSVEVGNILPTGVGFNFTTQGPGTYGISWDNNNSNLMVISSRTSDGSDGSYNVNPATAALVGSFRVNCLATPTSANFADLTEVMSSIGAANRLISVQWLGYGNKYRLTYNIRVENIGTSILKSVQSTLNLATAFPTLTISNVSTSFVNNPASLELNTGYTGTGTNTLLSGTKTLYTSLYNGANLNGGAGNVTAGSNYAVIQVVFDVTGVATNGTTTYNCTATATGTGFDGTTVTDNSDNSTSVETGAANFKADDAGEGDPTPIKFGSVVSGTVWNDANNSANGTLSNIFTAGESGTNAGGSLNAILIDPIANLVITSVPVAGNGTYAFTNVPSFANLQVLISATAGTPGSAPPAASVPPGWAFTSPGSTNTTGDINTGTYNANDLSRFGAVDDINNDFGVRLASASVSLSISSGTAFEASPADITVTATASAAVTANQTVTLTVSGTNITTGDYTLNALTQNTATITILNGMTTGTATFRAVDDALFEGPETAVLTISNPSSGLTLGATVSQNIGIEDNDGPEINLEGNGQNITDGDGMPSTTDHTDFGSAYLLSGNVMRTFKIKNTGNTDLTLDGAPNKVVIGGSHASDFTISEVPASPIVSNDSTTFKITFDPSAAGTRSATVSIENNDLNEDPFNFSIQGTGLNSTTSLSLTHPSSSLVNTSVILSATLNVTAPVPGPLAGQSVVFIITTPNSSVTISSAITNSSGVASVAYTLTQLGTYSIVANFSNLAAGYETSTSSVQTITVYAPVVLTCPTNKVHPACQTQTAVDLDFGSWLNSASASGGCNGLLNNNNSGAPSACGGSTTVTFTYTSTCGTLSSTCQATYTVASPSSVVLTCPVNVTEMPGQSQATIDGLFATWLGTASASGGCNGLLTNDNTGAPSASGGTTTVTFTYTTTCTSSATTTCQATFSVTAPNYINTTTNVTYASLQDAIDDADPMGNETIKLLTNISEPNVTITNSICIEADGFMLTIPSGTLSIPSGKTLTWKEDTLIIDAGALIDNDGTLINNGSISYQSGVGTFTNTGVYKGTGSFTGNFINNGSIFPGN